MKTDTAKQIAAAVAAKEAELKKLEETKSSNGLASPAFIAQVTTARTELQLLRNQLKAAEAEEPPYFHPHGNYPGKGTFATHPEEDAKIAKRKYDREHNPSTMEVRADEARRVAEEKRAEAERIADEANRLQTTWVSLCNARNLAQERSNRARHSLDNWRKSLGEDEKNMRDLCGDWTAGNTSMNFASRIATGRLALPIYETAVAAVEAQLAKAEASVAAFRRKNNIPEDEPDPA